MIESFWRRRPACWVVLLLSAGILFAEIVRLSSQVLIVGLAAILALTLTARRFVPRPVGWWLWGVLIVHVGWTIASVHRCEIAHDLLIPREAGERISIEGTVEGEPVRRKTKIDVEVLTSLPGSEHGSRPTTRLLLVQIPARASHRFPDSLQVGDVLRIVGTLEPFPGARNPGEFDYGRFLALNGIRGFVTADDSGGVTVLARGTAASFNHVVGKSRKSIYRLFDQFHRQEASSFLKGVVFGYRGELSAEVKQSFIATGTIHILAVSGSNVAVVTLIFFSLIGFLRVPIRVATGLTLLGLVWYMVITGLSPSVVRATIMAAAVLLGTVMGRKGDIYNSLGAAALLMLLWDPLSLYDVGFQLSFSAVLSIVGFYPRLEGLIDSSGWDILKRWRLAPILKLGAVSIAAQIGTLPFSVFYFGRVSLIAIVANLVVVPLSGLNTLLGFATIASSLLSAQIAACYAALNDLLVSFLLRFVHWSSQLPMASIEIPGAGIVSALIYYLIVIVLFFHHKPVVLRILALVALFLSNIWLYNEILQSAPRQLRVTLLDVGQGDAIVIEFPNGKRILVDAGPRNPAFDAGAKTIGPWLHRNGIRTLDVIVITHPHDDHLGGCPSILEGFEVNKLIVPDTAGAGGSVKSMLDLARRTGTGVAIVREGNCLQFDPLTRIFVLGPSGKRLSDDPNDRSIVLKILFGRSSLLLTGDASMIAESRMVRLSGALLSSDVLKVAHHGATTSSGELFLKAVRPSMALISVGRVNKFGHPAAATIERLRRFSASTSRTDLEGALVLRSDGSEFSLISWRKLGLM